MIKSIFAVNMKSVYFFKSNQNQFNFLSKLSNKFSLNTKMNKSLVNILIVFNNNNDIKVNSSQTNDLFNSMKRAINSLIGRNQYTIYNISEEELKSNNSWLSSTAFLITIGHKPINTFKQLFKNQINFTFDELMIGTNPDNNNEFNFNSDYFNERINAYFDINNDLNINSTEELTETDIYLITKNRNDLQFIELNEELIDSKIRLIDKKQIDCIETQAKVNSQPKIDLMINSNLENIGFDAKTYFSNLKTMRFGHNIVFEDITTTTMNLIESFKGIDGMVAIANQQTRGRGRNRNEWLSPKGCAMFTLQLSLDFYSKIGQKLSFIQHLAALSIVNCIKTIEGYEGLDIRVKWPNDVFCNKTKSKLSGILVTTVLSGNEVNVLIGCGINVFNKKPSICINDIIDNYNKETNNNLRHLTREEVIARTLNQFEKLMSICEEPNGISLIKQIYTQNWMHSEQSIKLMVNNEERDVTIEGIDDNGYLEVRDHANKQTMSLQPDGNRFDLMYNLIISCNSRII